MINKVNTYILILVLLTLIIGVFLLTTKNEYITSTVNVLGYTIEYIREIPEHEPETSNWSRINLLKNGKVLFATEEIQLFGGYYGDEVGDWLKDADDLKNRAIVDITGNGIPEIILKGYSGGAHCCSHNYIIELNESLNFLFDQDTGNNGIVLEDLNKDGVMEIKNFEDTFAYWHTSFAASPMPLVILSLQNGKYRADAKHMRISAPTDKEIREMVKAVENWSSSAGPEVPWKYVIDLIYSGNIVSAKKYVDLAWKENSLNEFGSKDEFWKKLADQIHKSPYYPDLKSYFGI